MVALLAHFYSQIRVTFPGQDHVKQSVEATIDLLLPL